MANMNVVPQMAGSGVLLILCGFVVYTTGRFMF